MMRSMMMMTAATMLSTPMAAQAQYSPPAVGKSEVGPEDELGRLSWMTEASRRAVMADATGKVDDFAIDHFIGMPSSPNVTCTGL